MSLENKIAEVLYRMWCRWASNLANEESLSAEKIEQWSKLWNQDYFQLQDFKRMPFETSAKEIMLTIKTHLEG